MVRTALTRYRWHHDRVFQCSLYTQTVAGTASSLCSSLNKPFLLPPSGPGQHHGFLVFRHCNLQLHHSGTQPARRCDVRVCTGANRYRAFPTQMIIPPGARCNKTTTHVRFIGRVSAPTPQAACIGCLLGEGCTMESSHASLPVNMHACHCVLQSDRYCSALTCLSNTSPY
jgi:hypothetical protein